MRKGNTDQILNKIRPNHPELYGFYSVYVTKQYIPRFKFS